MFEVHVKKIL